MSLISPWTLGSSVNSIGNVSCELDVAFSKTDVVEGSSSIVVVITSLKAVVACIFFGSKLCKATDCFSGMDKFYSNSI